MPKRWKRRCPVRHINLAVFERTYTGISPSFGDILDEVALAFPISKPRLVDAIDRFDDAVRVNERHVRTEGDVFVHPSAILVCLPVDVWSDVESQAALLPFEAVAIRAAHYRFATSIVGGRYERPHRSLLVLSASGTSAASD